ALAGEGVLPAPTGHCIQLNVFHGHAARTSPLREQRRVGVGAKDRRGRRVELAHDIDEWQPGLRGDGGGMGHDWGSSCWCGSTGRMLASNVSRLRKRSSAMRR